MKNVCIHRYTLGIRIKKKSIDLICYLISVKEKRVDGAQEYQI